MASVIDETGLKVFDPNAEAPKQDTKFDQLVAMINENTKTINKRLKKIEKKLKIIKDNTYRSAMFD